MELEKLEDVQGLRFQHSFVLDPTTTAGGDGSSDPDTSGGVVERSVLNSKYNVLVKNSGRRVRFYNVQKVIDAKEASEANLILTLDMSSNVISMVSPSRWNSRHDGVDELEEDDLLLIEVFDRVYIYSLFDHTYLYTHKKEGDSRVWYSAIRWDGVLMFLVIDRKGILNAVDLGKGANVLEYEILGKGDARDRVHSVSNVDGGKLLVSTRGNRLYLLELSSSTPDKGGKRGMNVGMRELKIKTTTSDDNDQVKEALEGAYRVVGCHVQDRMVLLALFLPEMSDNVVIMCQLLAVGGYEELVVRGYCYNELFMLIEPSDATTGGEVDHDATDPGVDVWIKFKYVEKWDLYIVYSNRSTSTLLITSNAKLLEANGSTASNSPIATTGTSGVNSASYWVLLMSEGYAFESNDFDSFVTDVFLYTNYKNEIYRKFSLEDTPTLKDPVIMGLLLDSGSACFFYVDRHLINSCNEEVEVLCGLYCVNRDKVLKISTLKDTKSDNTRLGDGRVGGVDDNVSKNSVDGNKVSRGTHIDSDFKSISMWKKTRQVQSAMTETGRAESQSISAEALVDRYYRIGHKNYHNDKRLFKLHEALSNSLDYFNSTLKISEGVASSNAVTASATDLCTDDSNIRLNKLKDYIVILKKLLTIQLNLYNKITSLDSASVLSMPNSISSSGSSGSGSHSVTDNIYVSSMSGSDTASFGGNISMSLGSGGGSNEGDKLYINSCDELLDKIYNLVDKVQVKHVESVSREQLAEVEPSLLYINKSLNTLSLRFDSLETKLAQLHDHLVYKELVSEEGCSNGKHRHVNGVEPTSTANYSPSGVTSSSHKFVEKRLNTLIDGIVEIYNRPLVDLSDEISKLGIGAGTPRSEGGNRTGASINGGIWNITGSGSSRTGGRFEGTKLKYNNYDLLFKSGSTGISSMVNERKSTTVESSSSSLAMTSGSDGLTRSEDVTTSSSGGVTSSSGTVSVFSSSKLGSVDSDSKRSDKDGDGTKTATVNEGAAIAGVDNDKGSFFGGNVTPTSGIGTTSAGVKLSTDSASDGKPKFGMVTSQLSGYNLVPCSLSSPKAVGASSASLPSQATGATGTSGMDSFGSVFASFNTNKSLLDIALNSSQSSSFPPSSFGSVLGATTTSTTGGNSQNGVLGTSTAFTGFGANSSFPTRNTSLFSGNTSGTPSLGGTNSPFTSTTNATNVGVGATPVVSSFTGVGNFATNSFPSGQLNTSLFSTNLAGNSLFSSTSSATPGLGFTNSSSLFSNQNALSNSSPFSNPSGATVGGGSPFADATNTSQSVKLDSDLWGASRRSNPLD